MAGNFGFNNHLDGGSGQNYTFHNQQNESSCPVFGETSVSINFPAQHSVTNSDNSHYTPDHQYNQTDYSSSYFNQGSSANRDYMCHPTYLSNTVNSYEHLQVTNLNSFRISESVRNLTSGRRHNNNNEVCNIISKNAQCVGFNQTGDSRLDIGMNKQQPSSVSNSFGGADSISKPISGRRQCYDNIVCNITPTNTQHVGYNQTGYPIAKMDIQHPSSAARSSLKSSTSYKQPTASRDAYLNTGFQVPNRNSFDTVSNSISGRYHNHLVNNTQCVGFNQTGDSRLEIDMNNQQPSLVASSLLNSSTPCKQPTASGDTYLNNTGFQVPIRNSLHSFDTVGNSILGKRQHYDIVANNTTSNSIQFVGFNLTGDSRLKIDMNNQQPSLVARSPLYSTTRYKPSTASRDAYLNNTGFRVPNRNSFRGSDCISKPISGKRQHYDNVVSNITSTNSQHVGFNQSGYSKAKMVMNQPSSVTSSSFKLRTSSKQSYDSYDDSVNAFLERCKLPAVKPTLYEDKVNKFIEENNKYCKSIATNLSTDKRKHTISREPDRRKRLHPSTSTFTEFKRPFPVQPLQHTSQRSSPVDCNVARSDTSNSSSTVINCTTKQFLDSEKPQTDEQDDISICQVDSLEKSYNQKFPVSRPPCKAKNQLKRPSLRTLSQHRDRRNLYHPMSSKQRGSSRYMRRKSQYLSSRSKSATESSSSPKMPNDESSSDKHCTEREALLQKYTKDYCSNEKQMRNKIKELSKLNVEENIQNESLLWTRMTPADLFYQPCSTSNVLMGTAKLDSLCKEFEDTLANRAEKVRSTQTKSLPPRKNKISIVKRKCGDSNSRSSSDSDTSTDEEGDSTMEELKRKQKHPYRLHPELWYNDFGEMNDGPFCRCSAKACRSGIRHNIYAGESNLPKCDINSNNTNTLHHYRITISPPTNFLIKTPTIISHDNHEFIFEGFSMFSHIRLDKLPVCKVIRFNIEYTILYFEEKMPENFTIRELELFYNYLFKEILELVDLDLKAAGDRTRCDRFHFMPRFVRELPENGKEILSMNEVLLYLLKSSEDLVKSSELEEIKLLPQYEWQRRVDEIKGMVITLPGMKPCSLRVDQLDRDEVDGKVSLYPEIVHFGIRPPQLSYAGNPEYQKVWREYVKFRHLLANMPKPSFDDKRKLGGKELKLQEMRTQNKMKRDVTVTVSSEGFKKTGIMCDIVQHAMLIPVLVSHLRFHCSLEVLEETIKYKFKNRYLLQLAMTHPSYRENFGTNPDHARNSLTNCGIRQPQYGDRRIHYMNTRKRGINTLINIMSRFGKKTETESNIAHNERLEFLGDAVVEFVTSIHLFHMFPELEEGGLATYRAAIVQNQHLALLAKTLKLDEFMLYAHGSDLCHDLELRHAMANCFEALMGALFLDGGIEAADKVFSETLFKDDSGLLDIWFNYPPHPLQEQEPLGDRKWIPKFELLKNLTNFEESIGVQFTHIRLLARAFTDRSIGFTNLTLGSNQRLEFLGDTVLQLIASEYLYKYFPEHHEGHLSLLRSSLVNNQTQAVVCNDLGMAKYAMYHNPKSELKTKDRADLLEAFLGALYVDKGLEFCEVFCNVCFFPRLQMFIMRQDWNDPKSKLQQCCLTLRSMKGGEPEIPFYKVVETNGPTNTRMYSVAVYFKHRRLAKSEAHSIQEAEMSAARIALYQCKRLFPQLDHQKRVIAKSLKTQCGLKTKPKAYRLKSVSKNENLNKQKQSVKRPIRNPRFQTKRNRVYKTVTEKSN